MFLKITILLALLGQLSYGVPLEDESADFSQFFHQDQDRIVGGTEADKGYSPHMVGLVVGFTWQSFVCGGSIISKKHILTAAHCITSFTTWEGGLMDTFHAVIGSNTWHKGDVVELKDYKIHPKYDHWDIKNDVGVLYTRRMISMSHRVAPIPLHHKHVDGNEKCFVTGWGTQWLWGNLPDKLQILYVNTITGLECIKGIQAASQDGWLTPPVDPKIEICTFHSPGHGMCHGDSGSALVSHKEGKQIGIVSWGVPCAVGGPDVFVRVSGVSDFINDCLKTGH